MNNTTNYYLYASNFCVGKKSSIFSESLDKNVQDDAHAKDDELFETPSKRTPQSTPRDTHKQRHDDDVEWQLYDAHSSAFGNVRVVVVVV